MKKSESKVKSSTSKPTVTAAPKTASPEAKKVPVSAPVSSGKAEKVSTKKSSPEAAISKSKSSVPVKTDRTTKTKLTPKIIPKTPAQKAKEALANPKNKTATGRSGRDKSQKSPKSNKPNKLTQVIPTSKPSFIATAPVKREKMLMRFGKPTKRVLFTVDFLLKASPTILYHFITTPSCLVRWFCDAVDITGEYFTFSWNGNIEVAELMDDIEDERLRFHWLDGEDDDEYFEFRISTADITDETILEIVDFAWADEVEEQKALWRTQVDRLRKETGDAGSSS